MLSLEAILSPEGQEANLQALAAAGNVRRVRTSLIKVGCSLHVADRECVRQQPPVSLGAMITGAWADGAARDGSHRVQGGEA